MARRYSESISIAPLPVQWTFGQLAAVRTHFSLLVGPAAALIVWILPLELEPAQHKAAAIICFMVMNWIAEPIDHGLTALIGCYLFWAFDVSKSSVAFSGFVNSTSWFLFGALLMAEAAARTGLAKRLGFLLMSRMGSSSTRLVFGLLVLSFVLALVVPSGIGRIAILAPLVAGIIKASDLDDSSNLARGLFVVLTTVSSLSDTMVLSGATSMMTRAILEEHAGIQLLWSQWFIAFLPLTVVTILVAMVIVQWMFPPEALQLPDGNQYFHRALTQMGPLSIAEKKSLVWFALAVCLWMTDFLHRTNPAVIGLGAGLLLSLPGIGVLDRKTVRQSNFMVILFSAGAISMGNVLVETNLLPLLTGGLIGWMKPLFRSTFLYTLILYCGGVMYHFVFANRQSMLITSLPMLLLFATAEGYNSVALSLLWTAGGGVAGYLYISRESM